MISFPRLQLFVCKEDKMRVTGGMSSQCEHKTQDNDMEQNMFTSFFIPDYPISEDTCKEASLDTITRFLSVFVLFMAT